jgi:hypothetical protein
VLGTKFVTPICCVRRNIMPAELLPEEPNDLDLEPEEPSDTSDLEFPELPCTDQDDAAWEAFIPDSDEWDPEPERGDFWIDDVVGVAA